MIPEQSLDALRAALGGDAVRTHDPVDVDGAKLAVTLYPADGEALAAALTTLARCGHGALLRGGGSRLDLGNPPTRAEVLVSTERMGGIDVFDADEGVCHARAGTPLARLREVAAENGLELPLDPPGAGATVGGTLAAAALGPRAQGHGTPRDAVLGLDVVLASGARTRCGGRVVKNVTGYDLNKLYTGSLGSLGVIEGAWLRLRPTPERVVVLEGPAPAGADAFGRCLAAARLATTRAAVLSRVSSRADLHFGVELAGAARAVEGDAEWLRAELALAPSPAATIDRLRDLQARLGGAGGLRLRFAAVPSRAAAALAALAASDAALLAHPGMGLVYAGFPADADPAACVEAVAELAREAGGSWRIESAPTRAKAGRDVFGDPTDALPIARALKQRFDPEGLLNAGRFAGHL